MENRSFVSLAQSTSIHKLFSLVDKSIVLGSVVWQTMSSFALTSLRFAVAREADAQVPCPAEY